MSATGHCFGHPVTHDERRGVWRYSDTWEMIAVQRACPKCGELPTADGHDPCIANLPGVVAACCGHGAHEGYARFADGRVIRGVFENEGEV